MSLIHQSFKLLYPEKEIPYSVSVKYSNKFKPYNANVRLYQNNLQFNLSKKWKTIDEEIKIGLIQSLLLKLFKSKKQTRNIELYNSFIKNIHLAAPKTQSDHELESSFSRVNQNYFYNILEKPNLRWGSSSSVKLGSYEYQTDTITVSSMLKHASNDLLDYIMYHELLHKKHKFYTVSNRNYHHTSEFKKAEKQFANINAVEAELRILCSKRRMKRGFLSMLFG